MTLADELRQDEQRLFDLNKVCAEPNRSCKGCQHRLARAIRLRRAADRLDALAAENRRLREVLEHALEWMGEDGCDCGVDEPGTCGLCRVERALAEGGQP